MSPVELYVNGQHRPGGRVTLIEDRMRRVTVAYVDLPDLGMYSEFIKEVDKAPSLGYVMNNWGRNEPTQT